MGPLRIETPCFEGRLLLAFLPEESMQPPSVGSMRRSHPHILSFWFLYVLKKITFKKFEIDQIDIKVGSTVEKIFS